MPLEENLFREWASEGKGDNIQLRDPFGGPNGGRCSGRSDLFGDEWLDFHSLVRVERCLEDHKQDGLPPESDLNIRLAQSRLLPRHSRTGN